MTDAHTAAESKQKKGPSSEFLPRRRTCKSAYERSYAPTKTELATSERDGLLFVAEKLHERGSGDTLVRDGGDDDDCDCEFHFTWLRLCLRG